MFYKTLFKNIYVKNFYLKIVKLKHTCMYTYIYIVKQIFCTKIIIFYHYLLFKNCEPSFGIFRTYIKIYLLPKLIDFRKKPPLKT